MKINFIWISTCIVFLLGACSNDKDENEPDLYQLYVKGKVIYNEWGVEHGNPKQHNLQGIKVQLVPISKDNQMLEEKYSTTVSDEDGNFEVKLRSYSSLVGSYSVVFEDIDGAKNGSFEKSETTLVLKEDTPVTMYNISNPNITVVHVMLPNENQ